MKSGTGNTTLESFAAEISVLIFRLPITTLLTENNLSILGHRTRLCIFGRKHAAEISVLIFAGQS